MRKLGFALLLCLQTTLLIAQDGGTGSHAPMPPMGWNSWDSYGRTIGEAEVRQTAEVMAKKLKRFGWQYVVIDEGWYVTNPADDPKQYRFAMDREGRFVPDTARYASAENDHGLKPLAEYVHSLGLKIGLHILRGIPRGAVERNLPIASSSFHANEAGDTNDVCPWNAYNYGVKDNAAGQAYYDSILTLYASWGVDFIKVDCIANNPYKADEIRMIAEAIKKTGRSIVLSLSPGPTSLEHADEVARYAEMWRTCNDFWDHWGKWKGQEWSQGLFDQFKTAADWAPHIKDGRWPDMDMLPLGWLGPHPGEKNVRQSSFTKDEQQTVMTLWAMARSPLMMGGNLSKLDDWTRQLLTNREVIEVDQDSSENRQVLRDGDTVIWSARPAKGKGYYVAVFNIGDSELKIDRSWAEIGLTNKSYRPRDLWLGKKTGKAKRLNVTLGAHASVLWRLE